jgi:glucosamine-6-phosphate deaminase
MVCVVPERRKADAVRRALRGPVSTACPASILRRQPHATLFLDAESAAEV